MAGASGIGPAAASMMAATTRSTGMTSTVPSGTPGNSFSRPAGVGDDHRLGHAEAADPARERLEDRRLDDRRPHDRHRHVAAVLQQRPLAEGLGVGVGVGPAERRGAGPPGLDHLLLHPGAAALLGLGRQGGDAGGAELGAGLLAEAGERVGAAAVGLGVGAGAAGAVDLAAPVDVDEERAVVHGDLRRRRRAGCRRRSRWTPTRGGA